MPSKKLDGYLQQNKNEMIDSDANRKPNEDLTVSFEHVTKTFHLYRNERSRFISMLGLGKKNRDLGTVNANCDLSFEIHKGEAVAFIGQNGAGKSTALKMVTGVSFPTSGTISVNGRVSALLDLNAGFDNRLTGRENIALRGQALGLTRKQIKELEPEIIEFASLGVYINQPMRTYSKGMKARLGFAFAISIDPEILIVDETLSVGDKNFKKKCVKRMREIISDENVTVLFVTHASDVAEEFCTRGIVLDQGRKVFDGSIEDAIAFYEDEV